MVNYFELYDLEVTFRPDKDLVKKKYYELSRQYHPDRFTLAGTEEQAEALKMSSFNNEAYKALKNEDTTMAYILKLYDLLEEEEKYNLPPDFLMEMMDLNEQISEMEMEDGNEDTQKQAKDALKVQLELWQGQVAPLIEQFENGDHSEELLKQIKDFHFRKKYLLRISERINTFAAH